MYADEQWYEVRVATMEHIAGNVRAFAPMGNSMLVMPGRKAQLKERNII